MPGNDQKEQYDIWTMSNGNNNHSKWLRPNKNSNPELRAASRCLCKSSWMFHRTAIGRPVTEQNQSCEIRKKSWCNMNILLVQNIMKKERDSKVLEDMTRVLSALRISQIQHYVIVIVIQIILRYNHQSAYNQISLSSSVNSCRSIS